MLKLLFIYFCEFVLVALLQSLALTCQTMSPVMSPRPVTCQRSVRSAPSASGRPSLNDRVENSGMPDCKCHGQIFVCKFCFQIKKKKLGGMWDIYKVFTMTEWQANSSVRSSLKKYNDSFFVHLEACWVDTLKHLMDDVVHIMSADLTSLNISRYPL